MQLTVDQVEETIQRVSVNAGIDVDARDIATQILMDRMGFGVGYGQYTESGLDGVDWVTYN